MGKVLSFAGQTEPVAFNRFGKNDRGLALMRNRCGIGCIHFVRIVTAPVEPRDLLVRQVRHHF